MQKTVKLYMREKGIDRLWKLRPLFRTRSWGIGRSEDTASTYVLYSEATIYHKPLTIFSKSQIRCVLVCYIYIFLHQDPVDVGVDVASSPL